MFLQAPQQQSSSTGFRPAAKAPSQATLTWAKTAIELLLLVIAVPWLLHELFTNPGRLSKRAAGHHLNTD